MNGDGIDDRLQDSRYLTEVTQQGEQQQPGWLGQILGNLAGSGATPQASSAANAFPGGALGKIALGGIAAAAISRLLGGGGLMSGHGGGYGGWYFWQQATW